MNRLRQSSNRTVSLSLRKLLTQLHLLYSVFSFQKTKPQTINSSAMASRRLIASLLRSSGARRPRSPFLSSPKPSLRASPAGHFRHRVAAHYATSAAATASTPSQSPSDGTGGKITDEFTWKRRDRVGVPGHRRRRRCSVWRRFAADSDSAGGYGQSDQACVGSRVSPGWKCGEVYRYGWDWRVSQGPARAQHRVSDYCEFRKSDLYFYLIFLLIGFRRMYTPLFAMYLMIIGLDLNFEAFLFWN